MAQERQGGAGAPVGAPKRYPVCMFSKRIATSRVRGVVLFFVEVEIHKALLAKYGQGGAGAPGGAPKR